MVRGRGRSFEVLEKDEQVFLQYRYSWQASVVPRGTLRWPRSGQLPHTWDLVKDAVVVMVMVEAVVQLALLATWLGRDWQCKAGSIHFAGAGHIMVAAPKRVPC